MVNLLLSILLPLSFILTDTTKLHLLQDLQKDLGQLQTSERHFISDNSSLSPSVETVVEDLQLFSLVANLNLSQASYTWQEQGPHQIHRWRLDEGNIRSITQIQSIIQLDTVVTQRYADNKPPTQQHIRNSFTFRTYLVSTASEQHKLYYLTEEEQGLLAYRIGEKQVKITYAASKAGLADVLPDFLRQLDNLTATL